MTRTRRRGERSLRVQVCFEEHRLSAGYLAEAYEQLVPVRCRPTQDGTKGSRPTTGQERREA
jgi:hypothetical protein